MIEKIELSIKCNLMSTTEALRREVEFDFNALTRSDQKTRYEAHRIGVYGGFVTPNEARRSEGLPDKAGGDTLYMQGANVRIDQIELIGQDNGNEKPSS
jgi:phage portal protein BeeE